MNRIASLALMVCACSPIAVTPDSGSGGGSAAGGGSGALGGGATGGGASATGGGGSSATGGGGGGTGATGGGNVIVYDGGFSQKFDFAVQGLPLFVAVGDLNGDGKPDIVTNTGTDLSFLFNTTPTGAAVPTFTPHADLHEATGSGTPPHVAIADLNADGRPDVLATMNNASVYLYANRMDGGATVPAFDETTLTLMQNARWVTTADFNADGRRDIAVRGIDTSGLALNAVVVFLNTTDAGAFPLTFAARASFPADIDGPGAVIAADVVRDGGADLVTENGVFVNTTSAGATVATFASERLLPMMATMRTNITSADFNADGKPDVAFGGANFPSVVINTTLQGTVSFVSTQLMAGTVPWGVATADFDRDGKPDLVTSNGSAHSFSVLLNRTTAGAEAASFVDSKDVDVTDAAWSVAVADIDGDGRADIVVTGDNKVSVVLSR